MKLTTKQNAQRFYIDCVECKKPVDMNNKHEIGYRSPDEVSFVVCVECNEFIENNFAEAMEICSRCELKKITCICEELNNEQ